MIGQLLMIDQPGVKHCSSSNTQVSAISRQTLKHAVQQYRKHRSESFQALIWASDCKGRAVATEFMPFGLHAECELLHAGLSSGLKNLQMGSSSQRTLLSARQMCPRLS